MKPKYLYFSACVLIISICSCKKVPTDWAWTDFVRPEGTNPIISPTSLSNFFCPMTKDSIHWECSDTFNPAATVFNDSIVVLYRAEDSLAQGIGMRTSRIGYASTADGTNYRRRSKPVMYPGDDDQTEFEIPGGCEDPRVCMAEDGTYVMMYTQWNRKVARLSVATSKDLLHWEKHGPAFWDANGGRYRDMFCKSGSIVTEIKNGRQVIANFNGKYLMYWGEEFVNLATSEDLVHWTPMLDKDGGLLHVMDVRPGCFDSMLTECGPPAIVTNKGILLFYNGKNASGEAGDQEFSANAYCGGQALFSSRRPEVLLDRLEKPFFYPEADFEKSGQYPSGTVFMEGLVPFKGLWYLFYGCADSRVSVAVYDPQTDK